MIHQLKLQQPYFDAVFNGYKTAEIRKNDRHYQVGDILILKEWPQTDEKKSIMATITHITPGGAHGIADDYVMLSIRNNQITLFP